MTNNSDLQFLTKRVGGSHTQREIDVSLTLVHNREDVALSISNKAVAMLGNPKYLTAAMLHNTLYLKPLNQALGFKLCSHKNSGRQARYATA